MKIKTLSGSQTKKSTNTIRRLSEMYKKHVPKADEVQFVFSFIYFSSLKTSFICRLILSEILVRTL